jgi:hypothetical protein
MATFQHRHYERIAAIMREVVPKASTKSQTRAEYREQIIRAFCAAFADDNEHFSEDRFRVACDPNGNYRPSPRHVGPAMPYVGARR